MNKEEFKNQIARVQIAYNKIFSREEMMLWYEEFRNEDKTEFEKAINKTIKEVVYKRKVADVRARMTISRDGHYINDPFVNLYTNKNVFRDFKESETNESS